MKMKKLISTFAAVVVLLSAVSNGAVVQAPAAAGGAEIKSVLTAEVPEAAKSETAKKEAPAPLKETAEQIAEDNDVFYEPGGESITVLSDSSAYINDSVSLFFTEKSTEQERQTVIDSLGGKVVGRTEFLNRYEVSVERSDIEKIDALCGELMELDAVEFASCNLVNRYEPNYVPDDPWDGFPDWSENANQWSARSSNWWLKAIDADKAWDYGDKFSHIDIGIVDSGFDVEHEDLQGKIKFPNSFFEKYNAPGGHGTHVAGIIGAKRDNQTGITGVVDDCTMICVDWEADKEDGQKWFSEARIMSGFVSVVRSGAKVVNFSLGSSGNIVNGTTDRYQFVKDIEGKFTSYIMAKLLQKGYDFICCQSAGNGVDMKDGTSYAVDSSNNGTFSTVTKKNAVNFVKGVTPQDIVDRIIIVASAKYDGQNSYSQSYFSNGGSTVPICAPGSSVYSTYYDRENQDHNYAYLSGTSMAAPVVTAVTALVWSVNPSFTGGEVKHFVCDLENTKYMAADSDDENHLPTGEIPMVNAQLAVEAAIKATYGCGTVEGAVDNMLDENDAINIEITSEYGRVYRTIADETGAFSLLLPQGEYTLSRVGKEEYDAEFTVTADETVTLETVILSKDNTALHAQNAMDIFKDALVEADII